MIHQNIVQHHGRVENIKLFNLDPTPFIKEAKLKAEAKVKAQQEAARLKQQAQANGEEVEEVKVAAAAPAAEEQKAPELEYKEYTNPGATIYDIFGVYGVENKSEIEANPGCSIDLWYDFTPFNSKDPVLLSLMTAKKY